MKAKIVIEFLDDGRIFVNGPIQDKVLCYGLLEAAKDAIREYGVANQNKIVTPHPLLNLQAMKERND
jgi:hypothetical protein